MASKKVAVVGGGMAGAATALSLAGQGIETVVIEASDTPRDAVGECLSGIGKAALSELGIEYEKIPKMPCNAIRSCWGSDELVERNALFQPGGYGDLIGRIALSTELRREVERRGVEWIDGAKVFGVSKEGSTWSVRYRTETGGEQRVEAGWVVDATGRAGVVLRHLGVVRKRHDNLTAVALRLDREYAPECEAVLWIEAVENGWWYLSPMPGGDIRLVFLTDADVVREEGDRDYWKRHWHERLLETRHIRGMLTELAGGASIEPRIVASGSQHAEGIRGDGWLAVGDAASAYDPLSSYGMTAALGGGLYAGRALAAAIDGHGEVLEVYEDRLDASFRAYRDQLADQYRRERRWPESPFWARRLSGATENI